MKKSTLSKIFLFCSLFMTLSAARAQYVAIPDTAFGLWLSTTGYYSCMTGSNASGWNLDTTCTNVMNDTILAGQDAGYSLNPNIHDLTGLVYFKSLRVFYCSQLHLNSLPILPASLLQLDCMLMGFTQLPVLPNSLRYLHCDHNDLTSLQPLPDSLIEIDCSYNRISNLPPLPPNLYNLTCDSNGISSLPALPTGLSILSCGKNNISTLPTLPPNLGYLICGNNNISSLPALPVRSLVFLVLNDNPISVINIPATNTIDNLTVSNCPNITCLPKCSFYRSAQLFIAGSGISCMPYRLSLNFCDVNLATVPLCTPTSGCDFYYNIAGNIHNDTAGNCANDSLYPGAKLRNMKVQLKKNGNLVQQFYTSASGEYSFKTDSLLSYDVSIDTTGLPLVVTCPVSGTRTVQLSATDSVKYNESFGITCPPYSDESVQSINGRFRVNRQSAVHIVAGDMSNILYGAGCSNHSSGSVTTIINGPSHFWAPAAGALVPLSVSGDTIRYSVADFDTVRAGDFDIIVLTDSNAAVGSSVCITTALHGSAEVNFSNDTLTQCFAVFNSYDPNLKTVSPVTTVDTGSQWLTYTVDFQNTGNDTAYTVVVKDTLSNYIDAASFQYLESSHHVVVQLSGSAMVFTFAKINMVDSMHNEPLSHGWIQYKVKTKPNLPLGTQIKNTASIYFDLNPAIQTNTTVNTVTVTNIHEGISDIRSATVQLYPNPASQYCTLVVSNAGAELSSQLLDISGREVMNLGRVTNGTQTFSIASLAKGIYLVRITDSNGQNLIKKLVVE
jgi:uncharacterized repeat protein (TIGR01451 family)